MNYCSLLILLLINISCSSKTEQLILQQRTTIEVDTSGNQNILVDEITYKSEDLNIGGYMISPEGAYNLPVILYIRGGNRDFGTIKKGLIDHLKYFARNGYIVIASQLRGNSFSEGTDEMGGKDINDVLSLVDLTRQMEETNHEKIGIYGFSRGAMMAFVISKVSDDIRAFVTLGGPTDLFLSSKNRPALYREVYFDLIGDTITRRHEFEKRSAIYWAEKLNDPLFIIHGEKDERVGVEHTHSLAGMLNESKKPDFQFKIFKDGSHGEMHSKKKEIN